MRKSAPNQILCLLVLLGIVFILAVPGCSPASHSIEDTPSGPDAKLAVKTATHPSSPAPDIIVPTKTISANNDLSGYQLESSTATSVPPTPVVLETLSQAEKDKVFQALLLSNGNCDLPCFWGIIPGKSDIDTVFGIYEPFADTRFGKPKKSANGMVWLYFEYTKKLSDYTLIELQLAVENSRITNITVGDLEEVFLLPTILEQYGAPDEIWISTEGRYHQWDVPFVIALFYLSRGILASYSASETWISDDGFVHGCFQSSPALWLWDSNLGLDRESLGIYFHLDYDGTINHSVEEALGINVLSFYDNYSGFKGLVCLETPAELWLEP